MTDPADRLRERLDLEEPILVEAFPLAELDRTTNTATLRDYRLPGGWLHDMTDVLFLIPPNYPAGCPDNVCARPDLRLANGELPANQQGVQVHAGRKWLQLSWHIDASAWAPTADPGRGSNLTTYLLGALARFDEAS